MKRKERIIVVLNPSSGVGSKDYATTIIFRKLRKHFNTVSVVNSKSPSHGFELAKQALGHFDIITVFGGDGTINSIAPALINTEKTLGIIPGGSGNGLVRNLNISLHWRKAINTLIYGKDVYIDIGKINNKHFFNIAGIGLDALIAKKFNLESKSRGLLPYIYYTLKGYFKMQPFHVQINNGKTTFQERIMIIAFANFKQYGGRLIIAPSASPYDNQLDLCILNHFGLLKFPKNIYRLYTGNIHKSTDYFSFKFKKIEIKSLGGKIPFHYDGEYGGKDLSAHSVEILTEKIKIRIPNPKLKM